MVVEGVNQKSSNEIAFLYKLPEWTTFRLRTGCRYHQLNEFVSLWLEPRELNVAVWSLPALGEPRSNELNVPAEAHSPSLSVDQIHCSEFSIS
jgi:hypothetical protein